MVQQQMQQQQHQNMQSNAFHPIGQPGDMMDLIRMLQAPARVVDKDIDNAGLVNGNNKNINKVNINRLTTVR